MKAVQPVIAPQLPSNEVGRIAQNVRKGVRRKGRGLCPFKTNKSFPFTKVILHK